MEKKVIKINENTIKQIVAECVKKVLKEETTSYGRRFDNLVGQVIQIADLFFDELNNYEQELRLGHSIDPQNDKTYLKLQDAAKSLMNAANILNGYNDDFYNNDDDDEL